MTSNPLLTTRAPEAALSVQLHPLVLLTISDYITRHTSRQQSDPIIGAIIGQQNGRTFTLEHAYECRTPTHPDDGTLALDAAWFDARLEQYRDVHKAPALDLVAIFMLGPVEGPGEVHQGFVRQVQEITSSDSVMLLLFHPELVDSLQGGKLPITLYESVKEQEGAGGEVEVKFRELSFEVETGEAEMIGVDFVATGAGVATAVPRADTTAASSTSTQPTPSESNSKEKKTKGKGKAKEDENGTTANGTSTSTTNILSAEDEELLASLTAKANAIKMLNQRLNLIRAYLQNQPQSYLTDATSTTLPQPASDTDAATGTGTETNHILLRSINAMLSRLPLLAPPTSTSTSTSNTTPSPQATSTIPDPSTNATTKETQDVHLTTLLASLTRSISEAQSLGGKFHVYTRDRAGRERDRDRFGGAQSLGRGSGGGFGGGGGRLGFGEESSLLSHSHHEGGGF